MKLPISYTSRAENRLEINKVRKFGYNHYKTHYNLEAQMIRDCEFIGFLLENH